jgi:hypothetical protein
VFNVWKDEEIKYWDLAPKVLQRGPEQELIPFLGAGVSVSDRQDVEPIPDPKYPSTATVDKIAKLLNVGGHARLYLDYALRIAVRMKAWEEVNGPPLDLGQFLAKLVGNAYPPFAWELAELLSQASSYHSLKERALAALEGKDLLSKEQREASKDVLLPMLKLAALTTDLGSATDPLTSISSYYESTSERRDLWRRLYDVMATKQTPTEAHRLLAEAATLQLAAKHADDYLVITTNYDSLMEKALEEKGQPYAVLRPNRRDGLIYTRFAGLDPEEIAFLEKRNEPRQPENCVLKKTRSMAVVYKMHGCLHRDLKEQDDGLVITDADYVEFISHIDRIVPAHVGQLLGAKQILFLGYSFSDWNVRTVYESAVKRRGEHQKQDYAVTRSLSRFEEVYFKNRNMIIVMAGLAKFVEGIRQHAPKVGV